MSGFGPGQRRVGDQTVRGQRDDPASPHFDDQTRRYLDRDFKDVAYYREDVEARAVATYHPGG